MDISADLDELANTSVMVVCAGCKSILDLKLTMEYLETKGVPVIGYGTGELPAFYTEIEPGKMMQTVLVFSVFSGAQSWVVNFDPHVFGEEASGEPFRFQIPPALLQ